MKLTKDIIAAVNKGIEKYGSPTKFAEQADISVNQLTTFIGDQTKMLKDETLSQVYPLIEKYMPENPASKSRKYPEEITMNERILLDAYSDLSKEMQDKAILYVVDLAKEELKKEAEIINE